jgi:hypothetical protein
VTQETRDIPAALAPVMRAGAAPLPDAAIKEAAGPPAVPTTLAVGRDLRIDMFRGLALVMIFVNHVPGTVYERLTSRNFGFSDAAEAFVLMSGIAAGLAYSRGFANGFNWPAVAKVWARARQLYLVQIVITVMALAVFAAAALWFDRAEMLTKNNVAALFEKPLSVIIGIPAMTHQLGYFNILPLYITLLLVTPALILLGSKKPWLLLGLSVLLWAVAGQLRLNFPNFPNPGGWFFNPFSWQILFVTGLLAGMAMKQGRTFFTFNPTLFWAAVGYLVLVLIWARTPPVGQIGWAALNGLRDLGAPFYIVGFDKTFLSLPRLSHVLALAYVLASLASVRAFAGTAYAQPLILLGRYGLPVFATGSVLSMVLQSVKSGTTGNPLSDGVLLAGGLAAQLALAWCLFKTDEMRGGKKKA